MKTGPHRLAEDVFVCLSDGRFVIMDLRGNRYLCLNRRNSQAAAGIFSLFPGGDGRTPRDTGNDDRDAVNAVLQALLDERLLAGNDERGMEAAPPRIQAVNRSLLPIGNACETGFHPGHLAAFFVAALTASSRLRWHPMHRSVRRVSARRRERGRTPAAGGCDTPELVRIFHRLRPLYGRKYLCLFDSLALLEFLARHRRFPQWVFGVRSAPFAAHCWVQEGDCVLNDTVERVRGYTPIMAA